MKKILLLKNARAFKDELTLMNKAYKELEQELDRLDLKDGLNLLDEDYQEKVDALDAALTQMKKSLYWKGYFSGRYEVYDINELPLH